MGIKDIWNKIFKGKNVTSKNRLLDIPLWTSPFGNDIYTSDIVLACIHAIAEESSKMVVKSVKKNKDGAIIENNDDLNALFSSRPNVLMTMKDMIYWTVWRLETKYNAYLFPEIVELKYSDGTIKEKIVAIYPIDSITENITYDEKTERYYITFSMKTGNDYQVPYDSIIHLRKHFESNSMFFGNTNRDELLKTLKTSATVQELLPKGIQASMQTKGILHAKSLSDVSGLKQFKKDFEATTKSGDSSISVLDVAGEFTPININPQVIDTGTLKYLEDKILKNFGVPLNVLLGCATENEWSSFYQKNIEPFKIEFEQVASSILFSQDKRSFGNRIKCYDKLVQHYTIATRLQIVKELGSRNYLSRSEQRELVGYEPDGGPEKVSLNFVDQDKANEYQGVGGGKDEGKSPKSVQSNGTDNDE